MQYEKGDILCGFTVLDSAPLPELSAHGVWLRHNHTGMEVYHIQCDDSENLFSFAFKTPSFDSTGVAHIIEHSVLCGSKNFPLKDPFLQLSNQSVKTFLNAMTFPDKTVYPASSMVEADYFNVMAVYADAVFFPLLEDRIFLQEGHRLEYDEAGKLGIKGVVYNEMKGNYSSLESICADWSVRSLLPDTAYAVDSGGDPACIPDVSYADFVAFHKKFYHPSNCRLFLYGNISLEKQLSFIVDRVLSAFNNEPPALPASFSCGNLVPFGAPKTLSVSAPSSSTENGATIVINWMTGETTDFVGTMELAFISELLLGHDGTPLSRALIESGLGEDIAPATGTETELKYTCFSVGLRGMRKNDAPKLEELVFSVLRTIAENGVSQTEIDAAVMSLDFSNREIRRAHGPFSLMLMRRSLKGWLHGLRPDATLINSRAFDVVKQNLAQNPRYVQSLVRKFFIDNVHRTTLIVSPDSKYEARNEAQTQKRLRALTHGMNKAQKLQFANGIKEAQQKLTAFQQQNEDESLLSLIPHIKPSDLSCDIDVVDTKRETLGDVPLFYTEEATNGIVYLECWIPVDVLSPNDYPLLPFFAGVATNVGFGGKSWADASAYVAQVCGDFGASLFTASPSSALTPTEVAERTKNDSCFARSWMYYRIKMLEEKTEAAAELLFSCINTSDFTDAKRIEDLLLEYRNDITSSVAPAGHQYCGTRAACGKNRSKAVEEIWTGITQLFSAIELAKTDVSSVIKDLTRIATALKNAGAVINITATKDGISKTKAALMPYVKSMHAPRAKYAAGDDAFYALTDLSRFGAHGNADGKCNGAANGNVDCKCNGAPHDASCVNDAPCVADASSDSRCTARLDASCVNDAPHAADASSAGEVFTAPLQIGFAAACTGASAFGTKNAVYEAVLAHWLTNSVLWEQIRTVGGAYGAFAYADANEQSFVLSSYRDPDPFRTRDVFTECLERACAFNFDQESVEKAITGTYSKEVQPRSPQARGSVGFIRQLYGITDDARRKKMQILVKTTAQDLALSAKNLLKAFKTGRTAIISAKIKKSTGKTIDLPL